MHVLHSGMDVKAHAATIGRDKERITVQREIMAARAAGALFNIEHGGLAPHYIETCRDPRRAGPFHPA